jgi:Lectin C-type domain
MKMMLLAILFTGFAFAQQAKAPKPPVGVPADAKHFNDNWYRYYAEKTTWQRAKTRCEAMGGRLAVVPDAKTWAFIQPLCRGHVWLGASNESDTGWMWISGAKVSFTAWAEGEPNNTNRIERYMIASNGLWNDVAKDNPAVTGYICEWKAK